MSKLTADFCHRGLILRAELTVWGPSRGARDSFNGRAGCGIQLEPDEPGGFDVDEIIVLDNEDDLTEVEIAEVLADDEALCEAIEEELEEMAKDRDAA